MLPFPRLVEYANILPPNTVLLRFRLTFNINTTIRSNYATIPNNDT
jgi:hypothetical protein